MVSAMEVKNLEEPDLISLRHIHSLYFKDEFSFPDFLYGYLKSFVVLDEDGRIITAGGVRPIMECVLITDLNRTPRERREALLLALEASILPCEQLGYTQLHAFVQDEVWIHHLEKYGFKSTVGKSLVLSF